MKLLVPPPFVASMFAALVWATNLVLPAGKVSFTGQAVLAAVFVVIGFAIAFTAGSAFRSASTQIDPRDPAKSEAIVTSGIFQYSRNPMYLGLALVLIGWSIWIGNAFSIALVWLFVWYISRFQIAPEEEALKAKFGAEYEAYLRKVRRWI